LADDPHASTDAPVPGFLRPLATSPSEFEAIDWQQAWMSPLRGQAVMPMVAAAVVARASVRTCAWRTAADMAVRASGLTNHRGRALHFVDQSALPECEAY
jgi:hypothetical protein